MVNIMWCTYRFALLAAFLYGTQSFTLPIPESVHEPNTPQTSDYIIAQSSGSTDICIDELCHQHGGRYLPDETGSRFRERLTSPSPASNHVQDCGITGLGCNIALCKGFGGRCLPSDSGTRCVQKIHSDTGLSRLTWSSTRPIRRACQSCLCRDENAVLLPSQRSIALKERIFGGGKCIMLNTRKMKCDFRRCVNADGSCILETGGFCVPHFPSHAATACDGCSCRMNRIGNWAFGQ
jgi:hypothetical protein